MHFCAEHRAADVLKRWHQQLGPRRLVGESSPRNVIAAGYLVNGPVVENLICLEDLMLTVLYDRQRTDGTMALRLAGYRGRSSTWGACWGGRCGQKFDKDLSLPPERCARGPRLELTRTALIEHALELNQRLEQASTDRGEPSSDLRLPTLWAAFRPADAGKLKPSGPEFDALRQRLALPPSQLLARYRRRYLGMTLLPLEWVSHAWQRWATLLADLEQFPSIQCLRRGTLDTQLRGYCGAVRFDLLSSRFAGQWTRSVQESA